MIANEINETNGTYKQYSSNGECRGCDWITIAEDLREIDRNVMPSTGADDISNEFDDETDECDLVQNTCERVQDMFRIRRMKCSATWRSNAFHRISCTVIYNRFLIRDGEFR
jgi:hypothetical protein